MTHRDAQTAPGEDRLLEHLLAESETAVSATCAQPVTSEEARGLREACALRREASRARVARLVTALPRNDRAVVLVVDDSSVMRLRIAGILREAGITAAAVEDAEQAEVFLDCHGPCAAVLLDINMPGLNGLDFLRLVRARWPDQAVLMVSAVQDRATICEALLLGAQDYVTKPFSEEGLLDKVRRIVFPGEWRFSEGRAAPDVG